MINCYNVFIDFNNFIMRLKESEKAAIKEAVGKFDLDAKIYLFGSRIDDSKRGGDIDLLVLSDKIKLKEKIKIKISLYKKIGEQKIDLISTPEIDTAFLKYVFQNSIRL